jgi:hypothetical protein
VKKKVLLVLGFWSVFLSAWALSPTPAGETAALKELPAPQQVFFSASQEASNWRGVEKILGRSGEKQDGMLKITFPRTDLNVLVAGAPLDPEMALTTCFVFKPMANGTLVTGDLVLLDQEVSKVLAPLARYGFQVTAIHHHLLSESPSIKYMHIVARGSRSNLAEALKSVLYATGTPQSAPEKPFSPASPVSTPNSLAGPGETWSGVEAFLGKGEVKGKILEFSFPRAEPVLEDGVEIPSFMGLATSLRFQKTRGRVAATGTFVLTAGEVGPVVETLTRNRIDVESIHNHMLAESPRLFFLHFWALGKPGEVALGLKEALEKTAFHRRDAEPAEGTK